MKVGLDLDGVVYAFQSTYLYLLNKYRGLEFPDGLDWWDSWSKAGDYLRPGDDAWAFSEGIKLGLFRQGHMLKGAHEGVLELGRTHELEIVTHRPAAAMRDTIAWLDLHFGGDALDDYPFAGIHLLTAEEPKSSVPGLDAYIDDGPHVAEDVLTSTEAKMLLWDAPYNQDIANHERLVRVSDWDQVLKELKDESKGN